MKKIILLGMALSVIFLMLFACKSAKNSKLPEGNPSLLSDVQDVQYIRVNWFSNVDYPITTVVSSKNELERYYDGNAVPDQTSLNATEKYSDDFFADNFLVIVLLQEGSGSIRHEVEKVDEDGNIVIKRLLPEVGTTDMAAWTIIVELRSDFKLDEFKAVFVD
jgi:hypothetical protein